MGPISTTSNNRDAVSMLWEAADSIYNQTQMHNVISKLDELITVLRR